MSYHPSNPFGAPLPKNITDLGSWRPMVIDLGSATSLTYQPSDLVDKVVQIWLIGTYVDNASSPRLKVQIDASGFDTQTSLVNDTVVAGPGIFLLEPGTGAAGVRRELGTPQPLFNWSEQANRLGRFRVSVSDWAGAAVTYTDLVLFFAVQVIDPAGASRTHSRALPYTEKQFGGLNEF